MNDAPLTSNSRLVRELRERTPHTDPSMCSFVMGEAADELERLRGQLDAAEHHVKILQEQRAADEPAACQHCEQYKRERDETIATHLAIVETLEKGQKVNSVLKAALAAAGDQLERLAPPPKACTLPGCTVLCRHAHDAEGPWVLPAEPPADPRLEHYWKYCNVLSHPSYFGFQEWLKQLDEDIAERTTPTGSDCQGCENGWPFDSDLGVHQDPNSSAAIRCTTSTKGDPHAKYVCVQPDFEVKVADEKTAIVAHVGSDKSALTEAMVTINERAAGETEAALCEHGVPDSRDCPSCIARTFGPAKEFR